MSFVLSEENGDIVEWPESSSESGETVSVKARKKKVTVALGKDDIQNFKPPVIAVLGSGGGLRAMVGLQGTLSKLSELKLLDVVTYVAGTSGSTWCMSFLYSNENWTEFSCIQNLERQLCKQLKKETERKWDEILKMMKERLLEEMYSLTDIWAYGVIFKMTNIINTGKLSGHKVACENGTHPYPIYSAVEREKLLKKDLRSWFEFTPHLSGFPAYNAYVKTEHLGSKFKGGSLLEKQAERDLTYLGGLWGSAFGDTVPHLAHRLLLDVFKDLISFLYKGASYLCTTCQKILDTLYHLVIHKDMGMQTNEDDMEKVWRTIANQIEEVLKTTEGINHCTADISDLWQGVKVLKHFVSCVLQWKWGTTNNFLYQCKEHDISNKEHISLIDAGLDINTPYLLMLPPHRKVDLILSFDFSQGDPFLTLTQTAEYCKKYKLPFPEINIDDNDKDIPSKSCYSFEGDGNEVPHVMHFPQFNTETCADAKNVKKLRKKYGTLVFSYGESQLKDLLDIAKKNVEKNNTKILEKIKQCVQQHNGI